MAERPLVVDTSSLINLLATKSEVEITVALGWHLTISSHTRRETLFLSSRPDEEGQRSRVPADLTPLVESGRLTIHALSADWVDVFVRCAEHLPDEDASAVALAAHLRVGLATDDPKEMKIAKRLFSGIKILSTLDWLHEAASVLAWSDERLLEVASNLRWCGNFLPPRRHPRRAWYLELLTRTGSDRTSQND